MSIYSCHVTIGQVFNILHCLIVYVQLSVLMAVSVHQHSCSVLQQLQYRSGTANWLDYRLVHFFGDSLHQSSPCNTSQTLVIHISVCQSLDLDP